MNRSLLAVLALVSAAQLGAQSAQPFSLQASVLRTRFDIEDADPLDGNGAEFQIRYTPAAMWSLGAGWQTSAHKKSGGDSEFKITMNGFFFEPRFTIDIGSDRFAPYVAGRLARLTANVKLRLVDEFGGVVEFEDDVSGNAYGGGGGLLIRLTTSLNFDAGAAFTRNTFEESFNSYVFKAGFSFGFGSR